MGCTLYQLLAGRLPYALEQLGPPEAMQAVCGAEPAMLSGIDARYRGDIETIAGKALEKEKTQRYGSAEELAADIRRHLLDQPIAATAPTATYQLRKFSRCHRALVAGVAAVFFALSAGVVVSTWQAVRARKAEASARTEAATAKAVNRFLQEDLLGQADPRKQAGAFGKPDPDLRVRALLDRAAARVDGSFTQMPVVEASIRETLSIAYANLGVSSSALPQLEKSFTLRRRWLCPENLDTLRTMNSLARVYRMQGKYEQSEQT